MRIEAAAALWGYASRAGKPPAIAAVRHFALGRYVRTNILSLMKHLGYLHGAEANLLLDADDVPLPCRGNIRLKPIARALPAQANVLGSPDPVPPGQPLDASETFIPARCSRHRSPPLLITTWCVSGTWASGIEEANGRSRGLANHLPRFRAPERVLDGQRRSVASLILPIEDLSNKPHGRATHIDLAIAVDSLLDELQASHPDWCSMVELKY